MSASAIALVLRFFARQLASPFPLRILIPHAGVGNLRRREWTGWRSIELPALRFRPHAPRRSGRW
jgi:hypothetical protein